MWNNEAAFQLPEGWKLRTINWVDNRIGKPFVHQMEHL